MKVAIIGAGLCGLMLANRLHRAGIDTTVFEKSRGLGGRLATKRLPWASIDIGAQYFTATTPLFQKQVDRWLASGVVLPWAFSPHKLGHHGLEPSPDNTQRYIGAPSMNSIAHDLARDTKVILESQVSALTNTHGVWSISTNGGLETEAQFDWIVSTLPAEQSADLFSDHAIFDLIPKNVHRPCWALALAVEGRIDSDIQGIFGDQTVSWVSRLSSRPERTSSTSYDDLWMLHFSDTWSAENGKHTPVDIPKVGFEWLSETLQQYAEKPMMRVKHYLHYWRYARLGEQSESYVPVIDAELKLAAIGAWSEGGRIEGAYISANKFADFLLK